MCTVMLQELKELPSVKSKESIDVHIVWHACYGAPAQS